jgi:hypothetical protein
VDGAPSKMAKVVDGAGKVIVRSERARTAAGLGIKVAISAAASPSTRMLPAC